MLNSLETCLVVDQRSDQWSRNQQHFQMQQEAEGSSESRLQEAANTAVSVTYIIKVSRQDANNAIVTRHTQKHLHTEKRTHSHVSAIYKLNMRPGINLPPEAVTLSTTPRWHKSTLAECWQSGIKLSQKISVDLDKPKPPAYNHQTSQLTELYTYKLTVGEVHRAE